MAIELFEMERMQSTWENVVDYDMSESGVRPLTLRELVDMGFDLESFLDVPLGYSQSNGTIELREQIAAHYPGATADHVEVTNGTSEANYMVALSQVRPGDQVAMQVPNYMQMPGVARSLGATVKTFSLRQDTGWQPDWNEFEQAVTPGTKLLYLSNPNNPTGAVLSDEAMARIARRCDETGTWLLSDEVYLGAEIDRPRTKSFWGLGRTGCRHEWIVEGVRDPRSSRRLAGRSATARVRGLDAARLHHHRSEQDVGPDRPRGGAAGESRALLRAHARDPETQPADRP